MMLREARGWSHRLKTSANFKTAEFWLLLVLLSDNVDVDVGVDDGAINNDASWTVLSKTALTATLRLNWALAPRAKDE